MGLEGFTDKQKAFCEYWLGSYTRMWADLTNKRFDPHALKKLIVYEIATRKRRHVIARLMGRLYKLRKQAAMVRVERAIKIPSTTPFLIMALDLDDNSYLEELDEGDSN